MGKSCVFLSLMVGCCGGTILRCTFAAYSNELNRKKKGSKKNPAVLKHLLQVHTTSKQLVKSISPLSKTLALPSKASRFISMSSILLWQAQSAITAVACWCCSSYTYTFCTDMYSISPPSSQIIADTTDFIPDLPCSKVQ